MYQCADSIYKVNGYIGLTGFTVSEIDTVVLNYYEHNGTFNHLNRSDTIIKNDLVIKNDTAYSTYTYNFFGSIDQYADYELIIPKALRTYRIANTTYPADSIEYYTRKSPCGGGTFTSAPRSATVNGIPVNITISYGATSILFLHK